MITPGQYWVIVNRHDINYLALSGALHAIGTHDGGPVVPLNIVGDFGGGGMLLALGIVSALLEARSSGKGQVVDASILDGAASLMTMMYSRLAMGVWTDRREANFLDGAAPYYTTYRCADGKWIAVGALEQEFFETLLQVLNIDTKRYGDREDRSLWKQQKALLVSIFNTKSRDHWCGLLEAIDTCVSPVLSLSEAASHPHNVQRQVLDQCLGLHHQPGSAPRFSSHDRRSPRQPPRLGEHTDEILREVNPRREGA